MTTIHDDVRRVRRRRAAGLAALALLLGGGGLLARGLASTPSPAGPALAPAPGCAPVATACRVDRIAPLASLPAAGEAGAFSTPATHAAALTSPARQ